MMNFFIEEKYFGFKNILNLKKFLNYFFCCHQIYIETLRNFCHFLDYKKQYTQ